MVDPAVATSVATVAINAFQEFRSWASTFQTRKRNLEEKELNAVKALQTAVIRTSIYVGTMENGQERDRTREEELAQLWSDAAIAFYAVNEKVAPLLHLKAVSWARPQEWIDDKVRAAGITLDEMNDIVTRILEKGNIGT